MRKFKNGFTMVELAVSLVIIGILVGMAVGVYRGVKNTTVHVQWQVLMNEAYDALVRYTVDTGQLPTNQAEFDAIFNKKVDDFNFGGGIIYSHNAMNNNDVSGTNYIHGGQICRLKKDRLNDVPGDRQILFTLSEGTTGRQGAIAPKEVQLAEFKSAIKCPIAQIPLSVVTQALPPYVPGSSYDVTLDIAGGDLTGGFKYQYCIEVKSTDVNKLKCRNDPNHVVNGNLFTTLFGTGNARVENDCRGGTIGGTKNRLLVIGVGGSKLEQLSSGTVPMKIFVRDSVGNVASKEISFVIDSPRYSTITGCDAL